MKGTRPGVPRLLRLSLPAGDSRHDVRQVSGEILSDGGPLSDVLARTGVRGGRLPEEIFQVRRRKRGGEGLVGSFQLFCLIFFNQSINQPVFICFAHARK